MGTYLENLRCWESFEVLEETIRRDKPAVASALRMGLSIVCKWTQPPQTDEDYMQSGARNPLDRLEIIIGAIEKKDAERAYVPIQWLCARFGFLPPVKAPASNETDEEIMNALLAWLQEIGETSAAFSEALRDGRISKRDYKKCSRELMEDVSAGMAILSKMKTRVE